MFKCVAFAFSLLLCTSVAGAEEPEWLKGARAREAKSLKPVEFVSKDGWFKARTPGKVVNRVEKVEGSYSVELDVGGDARVYCEIYPESTDLANALRVTFLSTLKEIEASQGKIEARVLESSDAGADGPVPYIALTWLYRVATADGPMVGGLKQFILEKGQQAVYCMHNDIGFSRTFATIRQAFADSLETQDPLVVPHYVEIATASMSGVKVGVSATTLDRDSDGDIRARQYTALLVATDDGTFRSQDAIHINWLRADGTLINAAEIESFNGELSLNLSLKDEEGTWTVEGEVQGKAVRTTLPKDSQPGTWVAQAQQLRALLAEPDAVGREHSMGIWLGDNPEKLTETRTTILARQDDRHFIARGEFASMTTNLILDKVTGTASAADFKMGPIDVKLERVYVIGIF